MPGALHKRDPYSTTRSTTIVPGTKPSTRKSWQFRPSTRGSFNHNPKITISASFRVLGSDAFKISSRNVDGRMQSEMNLAAMFGGNNLGGWWFVLSARTLPVPGALLEKEDTDHFYYGFYLRACSHVAIQEGTVRPVHYRLCHSPVWRPGWR
ncbi:hypothetical protein QBC44DRAFT_388329 [Cladorrhinum sp. PSN332]|nr:hypothetical protein QBC44DRAFT_388329 [Cladorrhinum sp. PSN332]